MNHAGFHWDEAALERLNQLLAEGLSGSQIALVLGLTRNAVLGKLFRLGLHTKNQPSRSTHIFHKRKLRRAHSQSPLEMRRRRIEAMSDKLEAVELDREHVENPTRFFDLEPDQCRWPIDGQGLAVLFCGAPVLGKHSYCAHHCTRAFNYLPAKTRAEMESHLRQLKKNYQAAA